MAEFNQPTAKIYQFPVKRAVPGARLHERAVPASRRVTANPVRIEYGSSWYHDAAIQDELDSDKR